MNRSFKKPNTPQQSKSTSNENSIQQLKVGLVIFKNAFEGIVKRIQCQTIAKFISQVGKQNTKIQKIKLIAYYAARSIKEKKQFVFNRLRIQRMAQIKNESGIKNLALIMKRITKKIIIQALSKLQGKDGNVRQGSSIDNKRPVRQSMKSGRQSSSSNVLSVSDQSMQDSRSITFDDNQLTQAEIQNIRRENEELKRMVLSEQARQSLLKMQRFDRYIYNIESEKVLKQPITNELRRLEKMKNQVKGMRSKFYDNELTITCLFNHVKLVSEMNRQLGDINALKQKLSEMQNKIAQLNSQHRKQIAEYKRKLLFFDVGSKDKSIGKDSSIIQAKNVAQIDSKSLQFNSDEQTTFNFILAALRNKKYKDARRQIDHFDKKSNKQTFLLIFRQVMSLIEDIQNSIQEMKNIEKFRSQIINNVAQFDKFLRSDKAEELQKLKNKCKSQQTFIELTQLFESVININTELRKLRKKESTSAQKEMRSAQKQKLKRSIENENEQLKRELKSMELKLADLEGEKQRLGQALKKSQKVKPSLPPRRPASTEKESMQQNQSQALKKYQESQNKMKRQIEQLNKQLAQNNQKYQAAQQKLEIKLIKVQEQCNQIKIQDKQIRNKLRQFESGAKFFTTIRQKRNEKQSYLREINDFKRLYPESIFYQLFIIAYNEDQFTQNITNQLKNILNLFNDNTWKRRINFAIKQETEIGNLLNNLVQLLFNVHQQKQEQLKIVDEMRKTEANLNRENTKNKEQIASLTQELSSSKEVKIKQQISSQTSLRDKMKTPQRPIKQSSQLSSLKDQNERLRCEVETLKNQILLTPKDTQIIQQNTKLQKQLNDKQNQLLILKQSPQIIQSNQQTDRKQRRSLIEDNNRLYFEKKLAMQTIESLKTEIDILKLQLNHKQIYRSERLNSEHLDDHQKIKQEIQVIPIEGMREHQSKLSEYEAKLILAEEKLTNYKYLFEKTKKERDNLKLLIDQKNQQYELCRQNQEKYEEIKRLSEQKIIELKYSYESSQLQIRKIQNQIQRLLSERDEMVAEKKIFEERMNQLIQLKDQQIQEVNRLLQDQISASRLLQHQIHHLQKKSELQILNIEQEKNYLSKCLQIAQEENARNRAKYEAQLQDYKNKCDQYTIELQQCKHDFSLQREIFRRKMNEFTQMNEYIPINKSSTEDREKQQLRKQLDLINEELANILRNNENQKRETRKYIQQIINEAQMQSSLYNEQKRILREEIERARNEEYAINQEKIRKLREDIQALRSQNQRLTSIIDQNQASFNQLVSEHKDMHEGILQLQDHNSHLQQAMNISEAQKQELLHRLQELEEKLADFQNKIVYAMNEGQLKQEEQLKKSQSIVDRLQATIHHLNQQKDYLTLKHSQQARQLIEMQRQIIRLQAQVNSHRNVDKERVQTNQNKSSDYSKYLQQKISFYQNQVKRYATKQQEMMAKIQNLIRTVNELEIEKQQFTSVRRDLELRFNLNKTEMERQIITFNEKISTLQILIKEKDQQIIMLKDQQSNQQSMQLQLKIKQFESINHKINLENYRLKSIAQEYNRNKVIFEQKTEQNQRLTLQNKRLTNKISMIQESSKIMEEKYLKSQQQIHKLQTKLQQNLFSNTFSSHNASLNGSSTDRSFKQELNWCKGQLKQQMEENNQLRIRQLSLQTLLKRNQQTLAQYIIKEEKYQQESYLHQQTKEKMKESEAQLIAQRSFRRSTEEDYKLAISQKDQEIALLKSANEQLNEQNYNIAEKLASSNKYQHQFLFEIAKQLDENYEIQGEEQELQIRILQKISTEISELVEMNTVFKKRCQLFQKVSHQRGGDSELSLLSSIRYMMHDFIAYLSNHQLINPEQIPTIPQETNPQKLIFELAPILKELFANSMKNNEEQIIKYNHMIKDIRASIDQFYRNSSLESLAKLRNLISPIDV